MPQPLFTEVESLYAEVAVIGYPDRGESQVILLKQSSNDSILFSCVIDCYRHKAINKTLEYLRANKVEKLNMFIWTHTDEDHSLDIQKLVQDFCNEKTEFHLPELAYGNVEDFIEYSAEIKASFETINSLNRHKNYNVNTVTVAAKYHNLIWRSIYRDTKTQKEVVFEILAVAPCSALLRRRAEKKSITNKNDLSIATVFKIGGLNLFFSGDIENQTISQIADYHFEKVQYLKTPHHSSPTSTGIIDKISENCPEGILKAVTTTYKKFYLPNLDVIDMYKVIAKKIVSTGAGNNDSGICYTKFHVTTTNIVEETLMGNAVVLYP